MSTPMFRHRAALVLLLAAKMLTAAPAESPFFHAIQRGNMAGVKRPLGGGASLNERDAGGTPALMAATPYAGADCVKLLLDSGADPNGTNSAAATADHLRAQSKSPESPALSTTGRSEYMESNCTSPLAALPISRSGGITSLIWVQTPFYLAARDGDAETMRILAAAGANPTTPTLPPPDRYPVVRKWRLPEPSSIDPAQLTTRAGGYSTLRRIEPEAIYRIAQGYKSDAGILPTAPYSGKV
jgi:ankyrin repeat protein